MSGAHDIEMTYPTAFAAQWAEVFGLPKWYRCRRCGSMSTAPLTTECLGSRAER